MAANNTNIFTSTITNTTFIITEEMSLRAVSILLKSGEGQVTGGLRVGSINSTALILDTDTPITLTAGDSGVIVGVTIDTTIGATGIVQLIGKNN
jgi:hypothetical protein|tara:strand:+ start:178 stop:462 length:285 start_codon:yes stop_codon:yes gene_type:complete